MLLGVHCSVSGGLENAFDEATQQEIDTFQIFTRNQRQWKSKPVSQDEVSRFKDGWSSDRVKLIFSHCSFLINLAAENPLILEKSVDALQQEVRRCTNLGLAYCVLHPGSYGSQSIKTGFSKIAQGLNIVLKATPDSDVMILLENTAGQGTSVGGTFENLARIREQVESHRIGYCFDTCHAFAAGYDIRTAAGWEDTMAAFDKHLHLENLKVFHLNDSKGNLGSKLDRHEHIGKGQLGLEPFRQVMQHFQHVPKVIETPKEDNMDAVNLSILRGLV